MYSDLAVGTGNGTVHILGNQGNGSFVETSNYLVGLYVEKILVQDVDGNNTPDLAVLDRLGATVIAMRNMGNGAFVNTFVGSTGASSWGIVTADLDRDGKLDIAVAGSPLRCFRGKGDGTFVLAGDYELAGTLLNATDLDNDGDTDLTSIGKNSDHVTFYLNRCLP